MGLGFVCLGKELYHLAFLEARTPCTYHLIWSCWCHGAFSHAYARGATYGWDRDTLRQLDYRRGHCYYLRLEMV